jgi:hypothetical protein
VTARKKLSAAEYKAAFADAFEAAAVTADVYLAQHPTEWYPCGFAWVVFDGRDPAVKYLRENRDTLGRLAGDRGFPKGWHIWNPSNSPTQWMDAKLAGARVFCEVLGRYGIECHAESRMD